MSAADDIPHLKQTQSKQGFAIGGIKSYLKDLRQRVDDLEERIYGVETLVYAMAVFMTVFYCVFMMSL